MKVFSFCLFESEENKNNYHAKKGRITPRQKSILYKVGLYKNLEMIKKFFPEWHVFLYTNIKSKHIDHCKNAFSNFQVFDVQDERYYIRLGMTLSRFGPLGDDRITHVVCRDLDNYINEESVGIINGWLESKKSFLITENRLPRVSDAKNPRIQRFIL